MICVKQNVLIEIVPLILLVCFCLISSATSNNSKCKFPSHTADHKTSMKILSSLEGKRYTAMDNSETYEYHFGICTSAEEITEAKYLKAGLIQIERNRTNPSKERKFILGTYESAVIKDGNNWLLLEYENGDKYHTHCGQTPRSASIMMLCNEKETTGVFRILEENTNRTKGNCYYLFEFEHSSVCHQRTALPHYYSAGDVLCIIFFCALTLYLLVGVLFNGIIRQRRGWDMLPNRSTWNNLGNLIADGCDFVFRSPNANLPASFHPYHPANSTPTDQTADLIAQSDSDSDHDDYLLHA